MRPPRRNRPAQLAAVLVTTVTAALAFALATVAHAEVTEAVSVEDAPVEIGHYELSLVTSFRDIEGSFDPYGAYNPYPDGSSAWSLVNTVSASYRFTQLIEAGISLPMHESQMQTSTGSSVTTSVGNPLLQARLHLGGWEHLTIHFGGTIPLQYSDRSVTGDPSFALPANLGDGATNGPTVHVGLGVSHTFGSFRTAFDGMAVYAFNWNQDMSDAPPGAAQQTMQPGMRFQLSQSGAYLLNQHWSLNAGTRQVWQLDTFSDGLDIPGTANRSYTTSVGATYMPNRNWRFSGNFETPFPFYAWALNQAYAPSVSLAMTYSGGLLERVLK